jgi:hypothetical protein
LKKALVLKGLEKRKRLGLTRGFGLKTGLRFNKGIGLRKKRWLESPLVFQLFAPDRKRYQGCIRMADNHRGASLCRHKKKE